MRSTTCATCSSDALDFMTTIMSITKPVEPSHRLGNLAPRHGRRAPSGVRNSLIDKRLQLQIASIHCSVAFCQSQFARFAGKASPRDVRAVVFADGGLRAAAPGLSWRHVRVPMRAGEPCMQPHCVDPRFQEPDEPGVGCSFAGRWSQCAARGSVGWRHAADDRCAMVAWRRDYG